MDPENVKDDLTENLVPKNVDTSNNWKNTFLSCLELLVIINTVFVTFTMVLNNQVTIQDMTFLYTSMISLCYIDNFQIYKVFGTKECIMSCSFVLFHGSWFIYFLFR